MGAGHSTMPAMIDCTTAAKALYDFIDGRMEPEALRSVQAHIDTCAACAPHFAFARRVLALLPASMPLTDAPHALRERIVASLREQGYADPGRRD